MSLRPQFCSKPPALPCGSPRPFLGGMEAHWRVLGGLGTKDRTEGKLWCSSFSLGGLWPGTHNQAVFWG